MFRVDCVVKIEKSLSRKITVFSFFLGKSENISLMPALPPYAHLCSQIADNSSMIYIQALYLKPR